MTLSGLTILLTRLQPPDRFPFPWRSGGLLRCVAGIESPNVVRNVHRPARVTEQVGGYRNAPSTNKRDLAHHRPPTSIAAPGDARGVFSCLGVGNLRPRPDPQTPSQQRGIMEILMIGIWTALIWWLSWSTCATLNRRRQHLYSRRLIAWERQARRDQALSHDMERLR